MLPLWGEVVVSLHAAAHRSKDGGIDRNGKQTEKEPPAPWARPPRGTLLVEMTDRCQVAPQGQNTLLQHCHSIGLDALFSL